MKKLSTLFLICILTLVGCGKVKSPDNNFIAIDTDKYTIMVDNYDYKVMGSGFLVFTNDSAATGQLLPESQRIDVLQKARDEGVIVTDESDYFIYGEGNAATDEAVTYTVVKKIDDRYSYLISYTDLDILLDIVKSFSFAHSEVTAIPTPTVDPTVEEEVHNHEH